MKVSIIMAARDTAPYIKECLDSIIAQTYRDWELLAVDDHSTDGTTEILQEYAQKDTRIRYIVSDGQRLIPALQTGFRHAAGELINRMDSDDRMPVDKLEVMVNAWKQHGRGHIVAGGTRHFVDDGEVGGGFLRYEQWLNEVARSNTHWQEIYTECVIPSHSWMAHIDDFRKAGAFDSDRYPEDYDLTFRFYASGFRVMGIDQVLHFWRDRSDRISRTWKEYKDVRYFDLKLDNFKKRDWEPTRPLVLWGAGKNGKDFAKGLQQRDMDFDWVCDNPRKIGKDVYGVRMHGIDRIHELADPVVLVVVSSPDDKKAIRNQLQLWGKSVQQDFWFFL